MHLLRHKDDDYELVTFNSSNVPPYAILSHTWVDGEEVTYNELRAGTGKDKTGYAKIRHCGELALRDGLEYFWVDTCCINKDSSAELSESINSMYRWYKEADVCYAYVQDWPSELDWDDLISVVPAKRSPNPEDLRRKRISSSAGGLHYSSPLRWFTRGWTLQELIAPRRMEFFDGDWKARGLKVEPTVLKNLSRITGMNSEVLSDITGSSLEKTCHGQRMSWAAYRHTSREEDIAYCLLGIFQVNMPLLYGEGAKAFLRLQETILASSTDLSLLAWTQDHPDRQTFRGIFARHPYEFRSLGRCRLENSQFSEPREVIMTNRGARMKTSLFQKKLTPTKLLHQDDVVFLFLGCHVDDDREWLAIGLVPTINFHVRAWPDTLCGISQVTRRHDIQTIYLARDFSGPSSGNHEEALLKGIKIILGDSELYALGIVEAWPLGHFAAITNTFVTGGLGVFIGYLLISVSPQLPLNAVHGRDPVATVMAVITQGSQQVEVAILSQSNADIFRDKMNFLTTLGSFARRMSFLRQWENVRQRLKPVTIQDHAAKLVLRIKGDVMDGGQKPSTEPDHEIVRNIVNISIDMERPMSSSERNDFRPIIRDSTS